MPTLAVGNKPRPPRPHPHIAPVAQAGQRGAPSGFTLLELMWVVLVFSLVTSLVVLRFEHQPVRDLNADAQRLAAQLDILRQQAWSQGQPLIWMARTTGYDWASQPPALTPTERTNAPNAPNSPALDPNSTSRVTWLSEETRSITPSLWIAAEPVSGPLVVELTSASHPQWRAIIQTQGLAPFRVNLVQSPAR